MLKYLKEYILSSNLREFLIVGLNQLGLNSPSDYKKSHVQAFAKALCDSDFSVGFTNQHKVAESIVTALALRNWKRTTRFNSIFYDKVITYLETYTPDTP